jgi:hypothetical protein
MHRSTLAERKDRWTFRHLGVRNRRGYGVYGDAPTWSRTTSRWERTPAFASQNSLLSRFSNLFFSTF